jgi:hypothetical protein
MGVHPPTNNNIAILISKGNLFMIVPLPKA